MAHSLGAKRKPLRGIVNPEDLIMTTQNPPITCSAAQLFYCSNAQLSPSPLYICRESSTNSPLFMQNKPNFQNGKMNTSSAITMNYEQLTMNYANKNKPNTNPIQSQFARG